MSTMKIRRNGQWDHVYTLLDLPDGSIPISKISGEIGSIKFQNISVPVSAWTANTTYDDYGFRAAIALSGVTASHFPEVVLGINEATSGAIAPICESYAGGVYIYASEKPDSTITIPSIVTI